MPLIRAFTKENSFLLGFIMGFLQGQALLAKVGVDLGSWIGSFWQGEGPKSCSLGWQKEVE